MKKILLSLISLFLIIRCNHNEAQEKIKLNMILNTLLKYELNQKKLSKKYKFLIDPELHKLKIYVPSQKEILGEEPGLPPFSNKNIIHLLDLKQDQSSKRKIDSLNLVKQKKYLFDSLVIDKKINPNIKIANKEEIKIRKNLYQFSNPIYFDNEFVYVETRYYDTSFGIGYGYLLKKQKDGNWKVLKVINTFIT